MFEFLKAGGLADDPYHAVFCGIELYVSSDTGTLNPSRVAPSNLLAQVDGLKIASLVPPRMKAGYGNRHRWGLSWLPG